MTTESTSTQSMQGEQPREITNLGVLDLTGMKSPDELNNVSAIKNVGIILVPKSLTGKLASIMMKNVGHTIPITDGKNIKVRTIMGPMTTTGEGMANPGEGENVLVVIGPLTITTPVEKVGYAHLVVMGPIVAPKGSEAALSAGITTLMGPMQFYPAGANVKVQIGDVKLSGKALANPTDSDKDVLVVVGELFITTPVEKVGYKQIAAVGHVLAPKESEDVLGPYLDVEGSVVWYTSTPRTFNGQDRFGAAFFELLKEPITMILNGQFTVESDVTVELLRDKVTEIILNGQLEGPKHLVPLLQVLATEKNGTIGVEGEGQKEDKA